MRYYFAIGVCHRCVCTSEFSSVLHWTAGLTSIVFTKNVVTFRLFPFSNGGVSTAFSILSFSLLVECLVVIIHLSNIGANCIFSLTILLYVVVMFYPPIIGDV